MLRSVLPDLLHYELLHVPCQVVPERQHLLCVLRGMHLLLRKCFELLLVCRHLCASRLNLLRLVLRGLHSGVTSDLHSLLGEHLPKQHDLSDVRYLLRDLLGTCD